MHPAGGQERYRQQSQPAIEQAQNHPGNRTDQANQQGLEGHHQLQAAPRHPHGTQNPVLAASLHHRQRQGVGHTHQRHQHGYRQHRHDSPRQGRHHSVDHNAVSSVALHLGLSQAPVQSSGQCRHVGGGGLVLHHDVGRVFVSYLSQYQAGVCSRFAAPRGGCGGGLGGFRGGVSRDRYGQFRPLFEALEVYRGHRQARNLDQHWTQRELDPAHTELHSGGIGPFLVPVPAADPHFIVFHPTQRTARVFGI